MVKLKTIYITEEDHHELGLIKAKDLELNSYGDVITRLLKEWRKNHK